MLKKQLSDIEIANKIKMYNIKKICKKIGISEDLIFQYGKYKAKIDINKLENIKENKNSNLILVTAITPTPAGEGKTTTSVGLADSLTKIGKKTIVALREPSLGPVFGMKGGAAGGGYSQVVPMEDINLHFTGDFHAIGVANNLLAALLDNHIYHGNLLKINIKKVVWKRVVDMNDRQLRYIIDGLNGNVNGVPREDGYDITVASEIMAILCLSNNIKELKNNLKKIIVAYNIEDKAVTAGDLKAEGALTVLLKDAINPNLVQTLEHTPAFIHGGPFANIAHGCNSILATKTALKFADFVVTEAGFGADLGAEKFIDIKCRIAKLNPKVVVLVATIRALKMHGGINKKELSIENVNAIVKGIVNLERHFLNIRDIYCLPVVIALNKFPIDTDLEINKVKEIFFKKYNIKVIISNVWEKGSLGGIELAKEVVLLAKKNKKHKFVYDLKDNIKEKIEKIVKKIYRGNGVIFSSIANKMIIKLEKMGFNKLPICMAKTQFSFSDNPLLLGAPKNFKIMINNVKISAGAGFIIVFTGKVMTMPGLPKKPAAEKIDIDKNGNIIGLF